MPLSKAARSGAPSTPEVTPAGARPSAQGQPGANSGSKVAAKQQTFATASRFTKGYDRTEVDEFFTRARVAYTVARSALGAGAPEAADVVPTGKDPATMTAEDIRSVAFTLRRGGYVVADVDAALDRLEDTLARAERVTLVTAKGEDALVGHLTELAESLQGRLERPDGERFARGLRGWERTYDVREVDALCERLTSYFAGVEEMSVDDVRHAAFRGRWGNLGYREPVVDAFLDRAVTIMSAVD